MWKVLNDFTRKTRRVQERWAKTKSPENSEQSQLFLKSPDSLLAYHPTSARNCLCIQVFLMKSVMKTGNTYSRLRNYLWIVHIHHRFASFFSSLNFNILSASPDLCLPSSWCWEEALVDLKEGPQPEKFPELTPLQFLWGVNVDETHINLQCNLLVTQIPRYIIMFLIHLSSSVSKRFWLVDFLTWLLLRESWSRQPVRWVKNLPSSFKGEQLPPFFLTQKFQYRKPYRNHTGHCTCGLTWTGSATSILGNIVA